MSELNNIGQNEQYRDGLVPEEKLMAYLEGSLPAEEQRAIEELLSEEGMMSDALEGLQGLNLPEAQQSVSKINYKLQKQLSKKRQRRKPVLQNRWLLLAIVLVLLLAVLGFVVIRLVAH